MITITLTDDEAKALEVYLGKANYYEQGAILCKEYETEKEIEASTHHLLRIYNKLVNA